MMDSSCHSMQSLCSVQSQPQSIVHQVIRLEKRVGTKVKKMFASKKNSDSKKSLHTASTRESSGSASVDLTRSFHLQSEDDDSLSSSYLDSDSTSIQELMDACCSLGSCSLDTEWDFETIDQNTFISRVLMDTLSETNYIIHFFSDDCLEYFDYEDQLTQILVNSTNTEFELYRISSQMAPLFTARLAIDPEKSTLVHVRKGKVLGKLDDLSDPKSREQVREWLVKAGEENEEFASVRHPVS